MELPNFVKNKSEDKILLNEIIKQRRISKIAEDRCKSPEERELESFRERERQDRIKEELKECRRKESGQFLSNGNNILHQKNIFKCNPEEAILKQRNIFAGGDNLNFLGRSTIF